MEKFLIVALYLSLAFSSAYADEGSCPKCVLIRKANAEKAKDQTWVFYEDWLETDEGKQHKDSGISFEEDGSSD